MTKEQLLDEALEEVGEKLDELAEVISNMPINNKVKDIILRKLIDWNDELNDACVLTPTDW